MRLRNSVSASSGMLTRKGRMALPVCSATAVMAGGSPPARDLVDGGSTVPSQRNERMSRMTSVADSRHCPRTRSPDGDHPEPTLARPAPAAAGADRKSTRLNSSHANISYAVFCLKKKKKHTHEHLV